MGGTKYLWKRPLIKHEYKDKEGSELPSHESWHELFFDLFYVALFIKLGDSMKYCGLTFNIFFSVFMIFLISWVTQVHMAIYMNRFYSEDLVHKLLYLLQHTGLFIMFLNVNENHKGHDYSCHVENAYLQGYAVGYIITRVGLMALYGIAMSYHEKALHMYTPQMISWVIDILIMGSTFLYDAEEFSSWAGAGISVATLIELLASSYKIKERMYMIPLDIEEVANRCSVFLMLVLGESVIQLIVPVFNLDNSVESYQFTLQGIVFVYLIALQYFDTAPHDPKHHALSKSFTRGMVWLWMHLFLSFALLLIGIALKLLYYHLEHASEHNLENENKLLSYSTGVSLVSITIIRLMHQGLRLETIKRKPKRTMAYFFRFLFAIFHFIVPFMVSPKDPNRNLLVHLILTLAIVIIDVSAHKRVVIQKEGGDKEYIIASGRFTSIESSAEHKGNPSFALRDSLMDQPSPGYEEGEERLSSRLFYDPSGDVGTYGLDSDDEHEEKSVDNDNDDDRRLFDSANLTENNV